MNKILLIPGSFNPITNAHVDMALAAKKAVNADIVYFIPAHDTYVAKKKTLIPGYCRVSLINSMPNCEKDNIWALDIETTSFFPQRTYNTITQLRDEAEKDYKFNEYYICLGMDNIKDLPAWYNLETVCRGIPVCSLCKGRTKIRNSFTGIRIDGIQRSFYRDSDSGKPYIIKFGSKSV